MNSTTVAVGLVDSPQAPENDKALKTLLRLGWMTVESVEVLAVSMANG